MCSKWPIYAVKTTLVVLPFCFMKLINKND